MSEQPVEEQPVVFYEDNVGPEAVGMVGPAHDDDGTNPGDEDDAVDGFMEGEPNVGGGADVVA